MSRSVGDQYGCGWAVGVAVGRSHQGCINAEWCRGTLDVLVIHGYGSSGQGGVIKDRLRAFCARFPDHLDAIAGEEVDGNAGMTDVTVLESFPNEIERLAQEIHRYCGRGRTTGEIDGRFRRHGKAHIDKATALLRRQGRLVRTRYGRGRAVHVGQ